MIVYFYKVPKLWFYYNVPFFFLINNSLGTKLKTIPCIFNNQYDSNNLKICNFIHSY